MAESTQVFDFEGTTIDVDVMVNRHVNSADYAAVIHHGGQQVKLGGTIQRGDVPLDEWGDATCCSLAAEDAFNRWRLDIG